MKDQVRIFRPQRVEVEIFDEKHELHRLTRGDVMDLVLLLSDEVKSGRMNLAAIEAMGAAVKKSGTVVISDLVAVVMAAGNTLDRLLKVSFPTFKEWENLPMEAEPALLEVVIGENDLPGIAANFSRLVETVSKIVPPDGQ